MELLSAELSAETLAALQAHLATAKLNEDSEVSEDFRLSQFWYDTRTGDALALEALEKSNGGPIAFVSTPAAFKALKAMHPERSDVYLFEYDPRFEEKYPSEFVFYDYNTPLAIDSKFEHFFDYVLVDPPYLVTSNTLMEFLVLDNFGYDDEMCLLAQMLRKDIFHDLGFTPCGFVPTFDSKLSNRFLTYTNYTSTRFGPCEEDFSDSDE